MNVTFTAHNIRLDDGTFTNPDVPILMEQHPWLLSAKRMLNVIFPGEKRQYRVVDLGCLEGGYSVEFARMGFQVLGVEVRDSNMAACRYVKDRTNLPNLEFVQDNAWNVANYGAFDAVFCCGLLYHLDRPKQFLQLLSTVTKKLLILQTHFATQKLESVHSLSQDSVENEGILGRWYVEFQDEKTFSNRDEYRWASWDNRKSFWIQREYLLQTIGNVGFDIVMEQFDSFSPDIANAILTGGYRTEARSTFIGLKS
jgi:SAM-dependent methyltransferase